MSKKTNKTLIGGFVVGALALAVVAVLIFGGGKFFSEKVKYVLYFESSVKGLNVGAPVIFKGIRIGSVTEIRREHPDRGAECLQLNLLLT